MGKRGAYIAISLLVIFFCVAVLFIIGVFPLLASPDTGNVNAALAALNHTPMTKVQSVQVFTGGQVEHVVKGTDSLGRPLDVIVIGNQVYPIDLQKMVTEAYAKDQVLHLKWPIARIISAIPGEYFPAVTATNASVNPVPVWEITAELRDGQFLFADVALNNGRLIYEHSSEPFVQVSPQVTGVF